MSVYQVVTFHCSQWNSKKGRTPRPSAP